MVRCFIHTVTIYRYKASHSRRVAHLAVRVLAVRKQEARKRNNEMRRVHAHRKRIDTSSSRRVEYLAARVLSVRKQEARKRNNEMRRVYTFTY